MDSKAILQDIEANLVNSTQRVMLHSHMLQLYIYTYICWIHTNAMNKDKRRLLSKKYTSHFITRFACERELETEQRLQYIDPHSFSFSWCSTGDPEAHSAECGLSLPHFVTNGSDLQLSDFLSSLSYIVVQSPTQSLEWHVWLSSSGNNCHAVQRSLSSGASVYECIMGLSHFVSQICLHDFFQLLAIGMCHFLPVHHFGMAYLAGSKVNIQQ